jgi:hypothetical protein
MGSRDFTPSAFLFEFPRPSAAVNRTGRASPELDDAAVPRNPRRIKKKKKKKNHSVGAHDVRARTSIHRARDPREYDIRETIAFERFVGTPSNGFQSGAYVRS